MDDRTDVPRKATARRRAIGYIRVSSVGGRSGPGYHTLEVQARSIEAICKARGYDLIDTYTEVDWSGADATRPKFREVMDRVLAGEADAVAVWKVSRFSRSWSQAAREVELLLHNEKALLSGEEGFDSADAMGRLLMQLLFSLADWEREVLAAQFETIKERVIDRGSHLGRVPVGYLKVRDKPRGDGDVSIPAAATILKKLGSSREPVHGSLVPDPDSAQMVRRAFEMRADGATVSAIRQMMDAECPRPSGGLWTATQAARMLTLRTYLGEVHQSGSKFRRSNLSAHEPIVPAELFAEVSVAAAAKVQRSPNGSFPLSGRVFCAACSYSMGGGQPTHKIKVWRSTGEPVGRGARTDRSEDEIIVQEQALRVYRCPGRRGTGRCPAPSSITADSLEAVVRARAVALEKLVAEITSTEEQDPAIEALTDRIETLTRRRERLMLMEAPEGDDGWEDLIGVATTERQKLVGELERLITAEHRGTIDIATWEQLTDDERLEVLRDSIQAIFVRRTDSRNDADDRIHIVWAGDGPAPTLGGRANRILPTRFSFPD